MELSLSLSSPGTSCRMFGGPQDLLNVGSEPMMAVLGCCCRGWAALRLTQLSEPILEVISEVESFAVSCWLPAVALIEPVALSWCNMLIKTSTVAWVMWQGQELAPRTVL